MSLCACGCGNEAPLAKRSRPYLGHIKGQPVKYLPGHCSKRSHPTGYDITDAGYDTPCWLWRGYKEGGYGRTWFDGRMERAHTVAYLKAGGAIPAGMVIDHLCRNRACVNLDHLEPVTPTENLRRGNVAKLSKQKAIEIRLKLAAGASLGQLAKEYGVTKQNIYYIRRGVTWVLEMQ